MNELDPVASMLEQASQVVTGAAGAGSSASASASQVCAQFQNVAHQVDQFAHYGLLPLCLALLLVHEHYRSVADGGAFRFAQVLARTFAVIALVLGYGKVCGLITSVAGAGSGWMTSNNYLALYDKGADSLGDAWDAWGGFTNLPKFIGIVLVWMILMISVLFAYVAAAFLQIVQAVTLSVLLGLGKTCIVVSLVPGVGLGKSWARALGQVAGWSTVAGVITGLLTSQNVAIGQLIVAGDFVALLKAATHFIILAFLTLSVPLITAKLFAGGAAGLTEVLPGYLAAKGIATGVANRLQGARNQSASAPAMAGGTAAQASGQARGYTKRVHKVPHTASSDAGASARRRPAIQTGASEEFRAERPTVNPPAPNRSPSAVPSSTPFPLVDDRTDSGS